MTKKQKRKQKIFIEALEQRIMLDGAGASTFLDLIDERNQQEIKKNSKIIDTSKDNNEVPFANVARDQNRKSVVFIDSAVSDYETIINSFKENTEFYLINSNEDGFKKIDQILTDRKDIDALHIIGHGSAGEILFGNAFLNNQTINDYQATLASIGQSLTTSGDILFYGCNVASTDQGELLIKKISEITKADIAASDDITGKGGDWDLEKMEGFIDVKSLNVRHYDHSLDTLTTSGIVANSAVTHIATTVTMLTSSQNKLGITNNGIATYTSQYALALERTGISVPSGTIISDLPLDSQNTSLSTGNQGTNGKNAEISGATQQTASSSMTVNSYLIGYTGGSNRATRSTFGSVVFDGEIVGIFMDLPKTRANTFSNSVQYHSSSHYYDMRSSSNTGTANKSDTDVGRALEDPDFYNTNYTSTSSRNSDWFSVGNYTGTNDYLSFGFNNNNTGTGDYIRVLVVENSNSAPVAVNDTDSINEGATEDVKSDMNHLLNDDTDADSDSLVVTHIGTGSNSDQAVSSGTNYDTGTSITTSYGTLIVGADGTYRYTASGSASNALADGETATDTFTYTISDGNGGTDTATLIYTITGVNDNPSATNDTGYIQEGKTLTVADGASANDADSDSDNNSATGDHTGDISGNDTDPDTNDTLTITTYSHTSSTGQGGAAGGSNSNSGTAGSDSVVGAYGTLDLEANGSYTYTANSDITNLDVDDETFTDVFTYTLSDGTTTTTATITITIEASGDVTAQDDTGTVNEDGTLTVSNDGNTASVDAATYDPSPFSISSQESSVQGFTFNNDGTKMFITGTSGEDINEYNLSTAFDVSTATFNDINGDGTGFSVGAQDTMPIDVSFNNDGTKMFVLGYFNRDVNEYTLTTGFDVSTASFVDSFSVGSQESQNHGLTFNNDGTKMFVVGAQGDDINEYTLSTGFDVSTASYTQNFSVSAQDTTPISLTFNNDGTKMFVVGNQGDDINEYTLSTGFDVSTASFVGEFSVSSQDPNPYDIEFNNDGTKLFMLGRQAGDISEYSLTTPFSLVDVTGENTGDVIDTSSSSNQDSDADGDTLTITAIRTGSSEGSGTAGTVGDALTGTYGQLTIASDGSYTYVANQAAADALDPGDVVTDAFNYTVSDGNGEDDIAVLTITVVGINDTPSADNETGDVNEDATLTVLDGTSDVLYDDTDVDDSSSLTVTTYSHTSATAVGGGSASTGNGNSNTAGSGTVVGYYGTLTLAADGTYTYAADQDTADALDATVDTVTDVFTYTVSDGNGGTDTATITITITGVNDAPVADDETNSTNVSTTLTVNDGSDDVLTGDMDADGSSSLTVTGIRIGQEGGSGTAGTVGNGLAGTYGTLTIASDGTYSYVAGSSAGTDYFTYTVSDGTATDTAQITITVNPANSAPTASNSTVYINENNQVSSAGDRTPSNITKVFAASDFNYSDADSDSLSKIQITTLESAGALEYSSDGSTWTDVTLNQEITATDIGNNKLRFTPAANSESDVTFRFKVHDGNQYSSSAYTMTVSVNAAPNVTDTTVAGTVAAGATTTSADIHDIVADSDDDDSVLVVTGVAAGNESTNNTIITDDTGVGGDGVDGTYGSLTVAADGTYTYTASATNSIAYGATATDTFTFTTRDDETNSGSYAYDVGTITFTVGSSISLTDDTDSVNEDATVTKTGAQDDVLNDDTADSNGLVVTHIKKDGGSNSAVTSSSTYNSNGTSVTGTYGTLTIGADGSYTYTADQAAADALNASDVVTDVFVYTADGDTANLTITVTGINDAPVAQDDVGVIVEGGTLTVANSANTNVSGSYDATGEHSGDVIDTSSASHTDSDADASASLTITEIRTGATENAGTSGTVGAALTGTYGQLTIASDGSYSYVANQAAADALDDTESAVDSFNYTLSDGTDTDFGVIRITVLGSNDAPTAVNDTDTATEGSVTTVTGSEDDVLNDDSDVDVETITVTNISHTNGNDESVTASTTYSNGQSIAGTYGTLVIGADGSYEFTPNDVLGASETGNDVFTYTVSDGDDTDTATLTITTTGANDAPVADNETGAVNEDATLTVTDGTSDLLYDDTDADSSDTLTVTTYSHTSATDQDGGSASTGNGNSNTAGSGAVVGYYGTLTLAADGTYTYAADQSVTDALDASDTVTDIFTYTLSDGSATDTATLTITITGVNDDPVGVTDTDSVQVSNTVTDATNSADTVISDDTDADDSSSLTVTAIQHSGAGSATSVTDGTTRADGASSVGTYGTLTIGSDGSYSYVAGSSAGTDVFTYTVSDGTATTTTTLTFTVSNGNPPVGVDDTDSVNEDATVTQSSGANLLVADDTDADGNSLTVTQIAKTGGSNSAVSSDSTYNSSGTQVTGTYGQLTVGADGSYTYVANQSAADTLDAGDTVTDSFTYTVSDGTNTDTATLVITVTGVNDDPVAADDTGAVNEDATLTVSTASSGVVQDNDTDPDGDDTAASLVVNAIEPFGGSSSSVTAGTTYANGTSVVGTYGTITIGADGTYTYTADQSAADALDAGETVTDVFTYLVVDSSGSAFDTANITITVTGVNDTPVAADDTGAVNEDATLTVSSAASGVVQDNDTDPDTDDTAASLEVSQIAVSGGSNSAVNSGSTYNSGTPTTVTGTYGQLTIGADGTYTYVANQSAADDLDAGDTATDTFTYTVTDTTGATSTADITITVTGVNDVPTASDNTVTTTEDTPYVFSTSDFGYTDADDDDALVSVKITTLEDDGALQYYNGTTWVDVTLNQVITANDISNGLLRLNPDANEIGSPYTTFNFTVNDGDADSSTPNTMTINVTNTNDAPVGVNDTDSVNEDSSVTKTGSQDDVLNDDSDADSDTLTVTLIGTGTDSDQAVASSSTYTSNGTTVTGTYGQLTIGADGSYTYTANQDAADDLDALDTATDTFTYTVSDGNGGTDTATLTFTVTGVNDVPTAADNTVTTTEDTPYVFSTSDFGYTDADDDDALVSIQITTLEDDGALQFYNGSAWVDVTLNQVVTAANISNGLLRLNPDANDNGSPYTTFAFTVNDGDADSSTPNTMTINVTPANDDPAADGESNTVTEGNTLTVTDGSDDLLDGDTDIDGDTLTVSGIRTGRESGSGTSGSVGNDLVGTYGTLKVNSDGTYTYIPNDVLGAGDTGRDYFTYTVSDGNGGTDTAELLIVVTGVNDDPVAVNDTNTINIENDTTLRVTNNSAKDVLTNDTDPDSGDTSTVTAIRTGATEGSGTAGTIGDELTGTYGTLTMNANGSYTYVVNDGLKDTLDPGEVVYEYFNYTASDGTATDTGSIVIKLQNGGAKVKDLRTKKGENLIKREAKAERKIQVEKIEVEADDPFELDLNKFEFEKVQRKTSYSQGLKLVDLVAETESIELSDGELSKVNVKQKQDTLNLKFKVMNETNNEIVKFEGKMSDGSDLPDWIKVNSKTGKTTTNIPEGVDKVDIIIVATDIKNEKREITIEINPEQIIKDKQIVKTAKRADARVSVGEDGNVNLIKQNIDGTIDTISTKTLNFNNRADIRNIIEAFKPEKTFQLRTVDIGTDLIINLPNELKGNFERTKLVLKDGSNIPDWLEYDPLTGEITAENPPEDLSLIELKLIIESNGEITVRDLEIDLGNTDVSEIIDPEEKNKFVAFNDQLEREFNDWDDYGNNLINRL